MSRGKIDPLLQQWLNDSTPSTSSHPRAASRNTKTAALFSEFEQPPTADELSAKPAAHQSAAAPSNPLDASAFSEQTLSSVERQSVSLSDAEPAARRRALVAIQGLLSDSRLQTKDKQSCFQLLLKPLLKRFADPQERCREIAVALIDEFVRTTEDIMPWLSFIIPVIGYRFSEQSQRETSEELRISLVRLIFNVLSSLDALPLSERERFYPYLMSTVAVLEQCAVDSAPEVAQNACFCLGMCCKVAGEPMHAYSVKLIKTIMPLLAHKHAKVRVTAIETIRALVPLGAAECIRDLCAFQESNVVNLDTFFTGESKTNYMGKLVTDEQFKVRWSFYSMVCDWMSHLPERYDYETLIMPYVLSGLGDDTPQIQQLAFETIHSIGKQYELDNEEQLKDELEFDSEIAALSWPGQPSLPSPFTDRPGLGSRIIVKRFIPRLIHAILNELADWKAATRERTMLLLQALTVYGEEQLTQHAQKLVSVLSGPKLWQEPALRPKVRRCLELLARFVHPDAVVPNLMLALEAENSWEPGSNGSALVESLKALFGAFPPQRLAKQAAALIEYLATGELLSSRNGAALTAASELVECASKAVYSMHWVLSSAAGSEVDTVAVVGERKGSSLAPSFLTAHKTVPVTEESLKAASDDTSFLIWQLASWLRSLERETGGKVAGMYRSIFESFSKSISALSIPSSETPGQDTAAFWAAFCASHADSVLEKLNQNANNRFSSGLCSAMLDLLADSIQTQGLHEKLPRELLQTVAAKHGISETLKGRLQLL